MAEGLFSDSPPWLLLAVIGVDKVDRVQCQCKGCGHGIYAAIHMVRSPGGEIQCWGSDCYAREVGLAQRPHAEPLYHGVNGRKLTEAERELLRTNRERLLAAFKAEHDEKLRQQEQARLAVEARRAQEAIARTEQDSAAAEEETPSPALPEWRSRLPRLTLPSVDYTRPGPGEPMDDPRYREIRGRKIEDWLRQGIDLKKFNHYKSLIENCLHEYRRSQRGRF